MSAENPTETIIAILSMIYATSERAVTLLEARADVEQLYDVGRALDAAAAGARSIAAGLMMQHAQSLSVAQAEPAPKGTVSH